jgi:hypothetical protein
MLVRDKHSSLLDHFVSYKENEVFEDDPGLLAYLTEILGQRWGCLQIQ